MTTGGQWPPSEHRDDMPAFDEGVPVSEPAKGETASNDSNEPPPRVGSIDFQDPSTTTPREPTLAERRARDRAERAQRESEDAWWAQQEKQAKRRKRILVGGAVGVGLVAVIALSYSGSHSSAEQARCVGPNNVVVDDNNCTQPAAQGSYYHGGSGFFPIFIGGGGQQYHYTYGGSGGIGQVATGGTTVAPRGTVTTSSGRTINPSSSDFGSSSKGSSSVSRGGFGSGSYRSSGS